MLTCSKCCCFCDNADIINGICDDCREAERKEEQRKQETERLMRAEYKQLELEEIFYENI